ncbi:hypothetical protein SAMN04488128_103831 [Chitinophaga eiseniae]|uniref:Uncharacterized protein n=1 Tax=Chitinophaga eiseniae TaxID=634771 RepID=A0A1T4SZM6_9BACT|nr:hypothetical protein [Chitinophaga eiseniae]SKA33388.1 hypothetical protein SAMN04488128_103831 [Chitinophaga eiseniae]
MKKVIPLLLMMAAVVAPGLLKGQDLVKGKLDFLKGVTDMQVRFMYNKMVVGEEGREANYIKRKKAEKEAKEPGSGVAWEEAWLGDRKKYYEPQFKESFTQFAEIKLTDDSTAATKYVMVVSTKFIEPGYNVGIASHKAGVNLDVEVFDKDNMKKSICKIIMDDVRAGKGQFATGPRIGVAYSKAGKELGRMIGKKKD